MKSADEVRICVPVCARRAMDLRPIIERAAREAEIIELRFDCLDEASLAPVLRELPDLLRGIPRHFIFTLRPAEQGGYRAVDFAERQHYWEHLAHHRVLDSGPRTSFADMELDFALTLAKSEARLDFTKIICSYHDFTGVPADLDRIYERMATTRASVLKIAVRANDVTDCLPLFGLLERARRDGRKMIAIAMGAAGVATRILGPSRGAFLTFAALDAGQTTAPGQLRPVDLRQLYRLDAVTEQTEITGLVGLPVTHSVSPHMHNAAFTVCGVDAVYVPFEVRDVEAFIRRMVHPRTRELNWRMRGLSVTAPHKSAIMKCLDWVEPRAREIGAVNTVVVAEKGDALHGYNTDAAGVLAPLLGRITLNGARAAVVGAGGAARAALWSLRQAGVQTTLHARDAERAAAVAKEFGASRAPLAGARFGHYDLVINTTPLGTRGPLENETPATAEQLRGARIVYDLVYNPSETRLMREALDAGCETIGGLPMLVAQAAEQFTLWYGREAPFAVMRRAAEKHLSGDDL